jgi:hypothetical protein
VRSLPGDVRVTQCLSRWPHLTWNVARIGGGPESSEPVADTDVVVPACDHPARRRDPLSLQDVLDDRPLWEDLLRHHYPGATTLVVEAISTAIHLDDGMTRETAQLVRWLSAADRERVLILWPHLATHLDDG